MAEAMLQQKIVRMRQRRTAPLILELDLTEGLVEEPPSDPVSAARASASPRGSNAAARTVSEESSSPTIAAVAGRKIVAPAGPQTASSTPRRSNAIASGVLCACSVRVTRPVAVSTSGDSPQTVTVSSS